MVAVWYLMQEHLQIVLSLKMLYLATKDLRKITIHSVIPHGHLAGQKQQALDKKGNTDSYSFR